MQTLVETIPTKQRFDHQPVTTTTEPQAFPSCSLQGQKCGEISGNHIYWSLLNRCANNVTDTSQLREAITTEIVCVVDPVLSALERGRRCGREWLVAQPDHTIIHYFKKFKSRPVSMEQIWFYWPKCFWNDRTKLSHFGQNVWRGRLLNTVTASFNITVRKWPKFLSKPMTEMLKKAGSDKP